MGTKIKDMTPDQLEIHRLKLEVGRLKGELEFANAAFEWHKKQAYDLMDELYILRNKEDDSPPF